MARVTIVAEEAKSVLLVVPRVKLADAVKAVLESRCFHPEPAGDPQLAPLVRRLRGEIEALEASLRDLLQKLEEVAARPPEVRREVEVVIEEEVDQSVSKVVNELTKNLESFEAYASKLLELVSEASDVKKALDVLTAYSFIDVDLEALRRSRYLRASLYRVPLDSLEDFETSLSALAGVVAIRVGGIEPDYATVVVIHIPDVEEQLERLATKCHGLKLEVPKGFPSVIPKALSYAKEEVERLAEEVKSRADLVAALRARIEAVKRLVAAMESVRLTRLVAVLKGYVSGHALKTFTAKLEQALGGSFALVVLSSRMGTHEAEERIAPSIVRVPRPLMPFFDTLTMFGYPRPGEIVPVCIMAVTLPVIYGLMFPDLGHGLVLLIAGIVLYKRFGRSSEGWRSIGLLITYFGLAAVVTGFLSGEFFGPLPALTSWLDRIWGGHPPYASPLHPFARKVEVMLKGGLTPEVMAELGLEAKKLILWVLFMSLCLGSFLLALSSWLGVVNGARLRDPELLKTSVGRAIVFTGVFVAFASGAILEPLSPAKGVGRVLMVAAGLRSYAEAELAGLAVRYLVLGGLAASFIAPLVYGHGRPGQRVLEGFFEVFDTVLLMIGNTASYVRIMGLMLAHSGLMFGFVVLAFLAGHPAGFAATYVLGNLLVLGLEALVAYAHSLRLHFYEMFTKFYVDGGRPYEPLSLPEYVRLTTLPRRS